MDKCANPECGHEKHWHSDIDRRCLRNPTCPCTRFQPADEHGPVEVVAEGDQCKSCGQYIKVGERQICTRRVGQLFPWCTAKAKPSKEPSYVEVHTSACHSGMDGDCDWEGCPQLRDGEPKKSGRDCPLLDQRVEPWTRQSFAEAQPPVECADKVKSKAVVYIRELMDGSFYLSGGGNGNSAYLARRMQVTEQNWFRDIYPPVVVLSADVVVRVKREADEAAKVLRMVTYPVRADELLKAVALLAMLPKEGNDG